MKTIIKVNNQTVAVIDNENSAWTGLIPVNDINDHDYALVARLLRKMGYVSGLPMIDREKGQMTYNFTKVKSLE
jgi:hypothetical protein